MSDFTFGDHDAKPETLEKGVYDIIVESCELLKDKEGNQRLTEQGKVLVKVVVVVDREHKIDAAMAVSFGQNKQTGQYAKFSQFIEATTGVRCGSQDQRSVKASDTVAKQARIMVGINDAGYNTIDAWMPAPKRKPAAAAAPIGTGYDDENEIPF